MAEIPTEDSFEIYLDERVRQFISTDCAASPETKKFFLSDINGTSFFLNKYPTKFAPNSQEALRASTPPAWDFFKTLPDLQAMTNKELKDILVVYAVCMEKQGARNRLYIGSAGQEEDGARCRVRHYSKKGFCRSTMAKYVRASLDDGYEIAYHGLLISIRKPDIGYKEVYNWLMVLEALMTWTLWSMYYAKGKKFISWWYMKDSCPWNLSMIS